MTTALIQLETDLHGPEACRGFSALPASAVCQVVVTASRGCPIAAANARALHAHLVWALHRQHAVRTPTRCRDTFGPGAAGCWASSHPGPVRRTLVWIVDATGAPPAVSLNPVASHPWTAVLPVLPAGVSASVLQGWVGTSNARWLGPVGVAGVVPDVLNASGLGLDGFRIFISYRRDDAHAFAEQLFDGLSHAGFDVYLDRFRTAPVTNFLERIRSELVDKACVVLLDSRDVHKSEWVAGEYGLARQYRLGLMAIDLPGGRRTFRRIETRLNLLRAKYRSAFDGATRLSDAKVQKAVAFVRQAYHMEISRRFRHQRRMVLDAAALAGIPAALRPDGLVEVSGAHPYVFCASSRPPGVEEFKRACEAVAPGGYRRGVVVGPLAAQMHQARVTTEWLAGAVGAAAVNELRIFKAMRNAAAGVL